MPYHTCHLWLSFVLQFVWPALKFILVIIHQSCSFRCYSTLFTSSSSRGSQLNPKVYSLYFAPVANLRLSSLPFIPFFAYNLFVANNFWWTSSFSCNKTVQCPPSAHLLLFHFKCKPTLRPATGKGVTNLFQPSPYCYIVAATKLLLHHCCYIVAVTSLLLHPTKTHFLRPPVPTTPSHLIHSRATLSVTISTDCCVYSQLSHTLHSGLTLAP